MERAGRGRLHRIGAGSTRRGLRRSGVTRTLYCAVAHADSPGVGWEGEWTTRVRRSSGELMRVTTLLRKPERSRAPSSQLGVRECL